MSPKISDELAHRLEQAGKTAAEIAIPVIVSVKPDANLDLVEQRGLKIEKRFENISAVAGTISAAVADQVAELDAVERIEYDGEMHALEG